MEILNDLGIGTIYWMYKAGCVFCALGVIALIIGGIFAFTAGIMADTYNDIAKAKKWLRLAVPLLVAGAVFLCAGISLPAFAEVEMAASYAVAKKVGSSD